MAQTAGRQLKLGAILPGALRCDWRDPDFPGDASIDIDWFIENARRAEAAKFDFIFIVDAPFIGPETPPFFVNRLEPLTLLSAVAASTSRIGLVATLTTSYWEPYNAARLFGSLDHISKGRAGWNVVTTGLEGSARNYGRQEHLDYRLRYARAKEFVEVLQGLWDTYEDDAFPRDRETNVFLDGSKQHALNHRGEHFSVAGPLGLSRSRQGQPVIFQAGDSDEGRNLGAAIAEAAFSSALEFETAQAYYADLKARAAALGRDPDLIKVMPSLVITIADTDAEAQAREDEHVSGVAIAKALVELGVAFNEHDFSQYPLEGPFPDVSHIRLNAYRGRAERAIRAAREEGLTLRETAWRFRTTRRSAFVGSAETVANEIERWFVGRAADGFNVHLSRPRDFALFCDHVVPVLQARGLFRIEYEHDTLRGHLGLEVPQNRYTRARQAAGAVAAQ